MVSLPSGDRLRFLLIRLRERLWVKPLALCLISIMAAFVARLADDTWLSLVVPEISVDSTSSLLSIMAASMLVIATLTVTSMVSAFASASTTATPRAFRLVVTDDVSQNALSVFIGAFIFSIVALAALKNNYFGKAGVFLLFAQMVVVFSIVILTFVRWVDCIARLGRVGSTIEKVENATARALKRRRDMPHMCGIRVSSEGSNSGQPVYGDTVGYVQHIDMETLQDWAGKNETTIRVVALPGTFAASDKVLAYIQASSKVESQDLEEVMKAFQIGRERLFDDDPRFGLVVLSEIAGRALSPGINDSGTAIMIIGAMVRIFTMWNKPASEEECEEACFDRIEVPEISLQDMFDDAFTAIARDGAAIVEVSIRLQKAFTALASLEHSHMQKICSQHAALALKRAEKSMLISEDFERVKSVSER